LDQDIRGIGSDIRENEKVLHKGTRLGPSELGVLASVGCDKFLVYKKPIVGILSTGDELQGPSGPLETGRVRDSNKTTLEALFEEAGFGTVDLGVARDEPDEIYRQLVMGIKIADVVVSTGGVSMGERDYMRQVLETDLKATIHFGSVLMKPGKPTTFATLFFGGTKKLIFGLPGNPASATVTAHLFVLPACRKLSGSQATSLPVIRATVDRDLKLDPTRPEYHRAHVSWSAESPDGLPLARSTGNQISSRLLSCNTANALLILPQAGTEVPGVKAGDVVEALMISPF
jgi:gephyrin